MLEQNKVFDAEHINALATLKKLKDLSLGGAPVSTSQVKQLFDSLPLTKIGLEEGQVAPFEMQRIRAFSRNRIYFYHAQAE